MNYSDSERIEAYLKELGFSQAKTQNSADLIIFNTCSVRQKAEDKVFGEMRKIKHLKKKNKNLIIALSGCMVRKTSSRNGENINTESQLKDALFSRIKILDIVFKIEDLPKLASLLREINPKIPEIKQEKLDNYFNIKPTYNSQQSTQAFIAISNGCDKFCTYCIVPYSRGREKSRKIQDILKEAEALVKKGCKEITLIGQTVNSYGLSKYDKEQKTFAHLGKKQPFVYLLKELDKFYKKGLRRIRFTSSHPKDMSDELINAMATLRTLQPYLHLPLQSGDNRTLKRMNRTYTIEHYRAIIEKLHKKIPDIAISTDIIVGFCGETDEEFENTYKVFDELGFEHAYLAQYSERPGTTAAKFMRDDVSNETKKKRWHRLNNLLRKKSAAALKKFKGKTVNVLVEEQKGSICTGRSEHYKTVEFKSGRKLLGEIVPVKITNSREWMLIGELA